MNAVPGRPQTPGEVASLLGINKDLSHRVVVALRNKDPIAIAHQLPGAAPLRRFIRAGVAKGVPSNLATEAENAVHNFDQLVREEAGDRSDFDAIISAWLPEARLRFEAVAKQSFFRGARHIKGIAANVVYHVIFFHPGEKPERLNTVQLRGYLGVRRVRLGATLKMGISSGNVPSDSSPQTLDGRSVRDLRGVFLDDFCSGPPIELDVFGSGERLVYAIKWGDAVGMRSARDIVMAEVRRGAPRAYRLPDDPRPRSGLTDAMVIPSRLYICDLIMHHTVYPAWEPQVRVLETGELGSADPNDDTRELDVLDVTERVEPLGMDIARFRAAEIPNYIELLGLVCETMSWDPKSFRGFRTRIEYPIYGSQVQYSFDVPIGPPT